MIDPLVTGSIDPREDDPIDAQLHRLGAGPPRTGVVPWHVRFGIGWAAGSPPIVLLLLLGAALGPAALAILTPGVLSAVDPAVPVALAALGVHIGLNLPLTRSAPDMRLFTAATCEALVTGAIVSTGILLLLAPRPAEATMETWLVALAAGICASMSSALPDAGTGMNTPASRLQSFDVIGATILGGVLLAGAREGSAREAAWLLAHATGLALTVAVAAWLLLARTLSDTERRIFGVASLLLIGGLADYLSLSAVLTGLVAGTFWRLVGGPAGESIRRDVGYLQHPLVVLLLVITGARVNAPGPGIAAAGAYILLRTVGKLLGGSMARRIGPPGLPHDVGLSLISPGVFGLAFALNAVRVAGDQGDPLLGMVVIGTVASQLIAAFRRSAGAPA